MPVVGTLAFAPAPALVALPKLSMMYGNGNLFDGSPETQGDQSW
jgi:hypothetical protein